MASPNDNHGILQHETVDVSDEKVGSRKLLYENVSNPGGADGSADLFPPGNIRLEDLRAPVGDRIILHPRPTDDPNDPLNWPNWRKYFNFGLASIYVVLTSEFINVATPTWGPMQKELNFSGAELNASYAIGCAFLGIGAVLLIPFALKFGRRPLYVLSSLAQCGISVWSAKMQTVAELLLVNVLGNGVGALAEVMVQMTIANVFFVHQRGRFNTMYIWVWQVSVSIGPMIAGYITKGQGWRWVWWWNAICFGLYSVAAFFGYEETKYIPSVSSPTQQSKATAAPKFTDDEGASSHEFVRNVNNAIPKRTYRQKLALTTKTQTEGGMKQFLRHMYQPMILLTTVPAVIYTALCYGILVALQDVMSTTFSLLMTKPPYNFGPDQIGLMNMPKLIGSTLGSLLVGPMSDVLILRLARRNNGIFEPEMRLWSLIPFLPLVPAGALMFGIGLNNKMPWPIIAVGLGMYKAGIAPVNIITITYLTDGYENVSPAKSSIVLSFTDTHDRLLVMHWLASRLFATPSVLLSYSLLGHGPRR